MHFLQALWKEIVPSTRIMAVYFCAFFVVFNILRKLTACNPKQPWWRKDSLTDIIYFFLVPVGTRFVRIFFIGILFSFLLLGGRSSEQIFRFLRQGYGPLGTMPIWLQAGIV